MGKYVPICGPLQIVFSLYVASRHMNSCAIYFSFSFSDYGRSSFTPSEGAVFSSKKNFIFSVFAFSMVESLVLFYCALFLRKPCPIFFYALEGALLSIWREFYSTHYVLGGSVEVQILQSILWPFHQDKVLPTTTLSDSPPPLVSLRTDK